MNTRWYQQPSLILLIFTAVTAIDGWLAWTWWTARQQAADAQDQLAACRELADQIIAIEAAPVVVGATERSSDSFNKLCEQAARETGIPLDTLVEIDPRVPRRVNDTPYQEQVTVIELRRVTLRQLIEFALAMRRVDAGLHVSSLSLREPPGNDQKPGTTEIWNVELALTTYIYAPKLPASR